VIRLWDNAVPISGQQRAQKARVISIDGGREISQSRR